ncbi:helix-turn-helix domain-containing protein [Enterococcus sp. BWT-B8]|nr:helix-turn-helix domain-containing protein [Enterococcus sp. BWT-B8]
MQPKQSVRTIASLMERSPSTISREIKHKLILLSLLRPCIPIGSKIVGGN